MWMETCCTRSRASLQSSPLNHPLRELATPRWRKQFQLVEPKDHSIDTMPGMRPAHSASALPLGLGQSGRIPGWDVLERCGLLPYSQSVCSQLLRARTRRSMSPQRLRRHRVLPTLSRREAAEPAQQGDVSTKPEAQSQPAAGQMKSPFKGQSSQNVDRFSGEGFTHISTVGSSDESDHDGEMLFSCVDNRYQLVIRGIPDVPPGLVLATVEWVSPSQIGRPTEEQGQFIDGDSGEREFQLTRTPIYFPRDLEAAILDEGVVTVRFIYSGSSSEWISTFDFGDLAAAEHWSAIVGCGK